MRLRGIAAGTGVAIGLGALALILAIVLGTMYIFGYGLFRRATADFRGQTGAIERIQADPDFRIAAYEHFFDLCSAVQADEGRFDSLQQELDTRPSDERREQIQATLTAVRASRLEKIRRYNTDASQDFTAGQFRAAELPYQLNPEGDTTCATD